MHSITEETYIARINRIVSLLKSIETATLVVQNQEPTVHKKYELLTLRNKEEHLVG